MKLFEDKMRTNMEWANHNDSTYEFCDRSAQDKIMRLRCVLNDWFSHYPVAESEVLKSRFKKSFHAALYELFLHELFLKQGFDIVIHPNVPNVTKHPDFLISKNNSEIYVEAKVSTGTSEEEKSLETRKGVLYDALNKMPSPNFMFGLKDVTLKNTQDPPLDKLKDFITSEMKQYDPDMIEQLFQTNQNWDDLPCINFDDRNIKVSLVLIPVSKENRNNTSLKPIAMYPSELLLSESRSIKNALRKKATRYGSLDKPYVICVNSTQGVKVSDRDAMYAVLGSLQYPYPLSNVHDGFFGNRNNYQHTRVSAVFISNMVLGSHCNPDYWFFKHPDAQREVDFELFDLSYYQLESNQVCKHEGLSIGEILSIPKEWR